MHPNDANINLFVPKRFDGMSMNDDEKATRNVNASMKARPSIRHVEKRRTSTCQFADRIAKLSIGHYRKIVPKKHQGTSTCLATVVAYDSQTDSFAILGMVRSRSVYCVLLGRIVDGLHFLKVFELFRV